MSLVSPGQSVPCCIDVDAAYAPKARYALEALLVPLGLDPRWTDAETAAIVYGSAAESPAALRLPYAPDAAGFFSNDEAFNADNAVSMSVDGVEVPVCFTDADGAPDVVASSFLWLSGWQERAGSPRDEHGRAPYAYSLNARFGTAALPVVDQLRRHLDNRLRAAGIEPHPRRWDGRRWAFCPTHDVDYLRKWRPGILYRELVQHLVLNRRRVPMRGRLRRAGKVVGQMLGGDPYLRALHEMPGDVSGRGGTATYFVKSGGGDPHDVPYRIGSPLLRDWMVRLRQGGFEVGLHPSYGTPEDPERLREEKTRLERAAETDVVAVRQHYLRYDPDRTPAQHEQLGFGIDSTLGYAEHEGFRRGTCLPFRVYDLVNDRPTDVWEMSPALMESALFRRRHLDALEAARVTRELCAACRRYGGVFVGLWHTTLGDEIDCAGWQAHFLDALDAAESDGALTTSLSGALRTWR